MKKTLFAVAAVSMFMAGCTKEQDLSNYLTREEAQELIDQNSSTPQYNTCTTYQFNVTFPAVTDQYSSEVIYEGLVGKLNKNDALLMYMYWSGTWAALPFCQGNASYVYFRYDNGKLKFCSGRALYLTFSQEAEEATMKAYVIPHTLASKLMSSGVDLSTPEMVETALAAENVAVATAR